MRLSRPNPELNWLLLILCLALPLLARAQTVILHLKNGDRLTGTLVSQDTNRVVLTTSWTKELAVPAEQIQSRETNAAAAVMAKGGRAQAPGTNNASTTNGGYRVGPLIVGGMSPLPPPLPSKRWSGELRVGASFLYGANNQQVYSGRMKLAYERPYASNHKEYFRNTLDFSLDYGWLAVSNQPSTLTADQMDISDKTTADIGKRYYVYDLAGAGYDTIREISLREEIGPGLGYHLFTQTNFIVNVETGMDYQGQYYTDPAQTSQRYIYYRFGQEINWSLGPQWSLLEKAEYFPRTDASQYHARFETTLSYLLWKYFTFNITALDIYDSLPAAGVPQNDLQIRSSFGFKF